MKIWKREATVPELNAKWLGGMANHLGIEVTELGDDYLKGKMLVSNKATQPFGMLHGGASCVLGETLGSVASHLCLEGGNQYAVGTQLSAYHVRPVTEGNMIFAKAVAKHIGRRTHLWTIEITNDAGKMVCEVTLATAVLER